jgi:multicomponent Na+:H+ antiporter subunit G
MSNVTDYVGGAFILAGVGFMLIGALGFYRLPDFYARLHAAGLSDTFGLSLVLAGAVVVCGFSLMSAKLVLLALFMFVTAPTATHMLAGAAYRSDAAKERKGKE